MSRSTTINEHTLEFHGLHLHRQKEPLLCRLGKGREGGHVVTQRSPTLRAVCKRGQGMGLGIPRKEKKKGDESARVGGDAPEHNGCSSVGSEWAAS